MEFENFQEEDLKMNPGKLIDSDVFIDFLRGKPDAVDFFKKVFPDINISVITTGELFAGVRDGPERIKLEEALNTCHQIEVTPDIAKMAGLFKRDFEKSHQITLPDALIAATAKELGFSLVTLNRRHFPMLTDIVIPYQKT